MKQCFQIISQANAALSRNAAYQISCTCRLQDPSTDAPYTVQVVGVVERPDKMCLNVSHDHVLQYQVFCDGRNEVYYNVRTKKYSIFDPSGMVDPSVVGGMLSPIFMSTSSVVMSANLLTHDLMNGNFFLVLAVGNGTIKLISSQSGERKDIFCGFDYRSSTKFSALSNGSKQSVPVTSTSSECLFRIDPTVKFPIAYKSISAIGGGSDIGYDITYTKVIPTGALPITAFEWTPPADARKFVDSQP